MFKTRNTRYKMPLMDFSRYLIWRFSIRFNIFHNNPVSPPPTSVLGGDVIYRRRALLPLAVADQIAV